MLPYNKKLVKNAQELRKNMTPEEKHLWYDFLKNLPMNVRRQHNVGNYIVDFYIAEKKIAIEVDGIQHTSDENKKSDSERDAALARWGIKTLRYSNKSIKQSFSAVAQDILNNLRIGFEELKNRTPHPPSKLGPPSPTGEGKNSRKENGK